MKRFLSTFVIGALLLGGQDVATISVNVRLVRVACTATRANGQVVTGLTQKDFQLRDRGVPQEVRYFWREDDLPLTVGLVVDVSGSQMRNLAKHRATIRQFLTQVLRPGDRAFLVTVATNVRLLRDFTDQASVLADDVDYRLRDRGTPFGLDCIPPSEGVQYGVQGSGGAADGGGRLATGEWERIRRIFCPVIQAAQPVASKGSRAFPG